jgi:ClpP class serine protease
VGNVGVIGYLPPAPSIFEGTISTGPYKLFGTPRDTYTRQIEMIKQGFYQAVLLGRGDKLEAGPDVILRGEIWPAAEALRMGLIDEIGAGSEAIDKAAQMAHVSNYEVADLLTLVGSNQSTTSPPFFLADINGMTLPYPAESGIYLLYVPPTARGK